MTKEIKKIGVFTSGGDAPGMNATIRAVVRTARYYGIQVAGISQGYKGMLENNIKTLQKGDVANIIHRGGTVLRTARCLEFIEEEGREIAYQNLKKNDIDACVAIGGNGTYTGAMKFTAKYGIPFIGLPGTIDNDIYGTDNTIGFDTAVNTAMEALDKIRDTAESHDRLFIVEVMGRHAGFIGLNTGIGSGASALFLPEVENSVELLVKHLKTSAKRNKLFNLVVVSEGNKNGDAVAISKLLKTEHDIDSKIFIMGHIQRGGSPSGLDRVLATRLGYHAVKCLLNKEYNIALGIVNDRVKKTSFKDAIYKTKDLNSELVEMADILSL